MYIHHLLQYVGHLCHHKIYLNIVVLVDKIYR